MRNTIVSFCFALIAFSLLPSCGKKKSDGQQGPPPVQVTAYKVETGKADYYDSYPATVTALNQVELRPEVSGIITDIFVKDGSHVHKGMKLYAIDQQQYKAAYEQAVANLNVAKSNLNRAQQDADRYNALAQKDAIARQQLEHAQADLQSAKMQVQAAEANVHGVQTNLRYSTIVAPFDGTIGFSSVKLGSSVSTGQTLLNTISSDNPMAVDFAVDEKQISRFSELLGKKTNINDSTFTLALPDQTIYPYPGQLSLLDRAVDPTTGTLRARVVFPNPKGVLRAGMTCDLRVRNNSAQKSLLIPYRAATEQMGEYFVFVINDNKASQRKVNLGMNIGDMVIVNNGLNPGDLIVVDGVQKLRENTPVKVVPPGQSAQQAPGSNNPNPQGQNPNQGQTTNQGKNENQGKNRNQGAQQGQK